MHKLAEKTRKGELQKREVQQMGRREGVKRGRHTSVH
jgi:hypothetical protein